MYPANSVFRASLGWFVSLGFGSNNLVVAFYDAGEEVPNSDHREILETVQIFSQGDRETNIVSIKKQERLLEISSQD